MKPDPKVIDLLRKAAIAGTSPSLYELNSALAELCRLRDEAEVSTLEERQAWDRYAAAELSGDASGEVPPSQIAKGADEVLAERRKRFGSAK